MDKVTDDYEFNVDAEVLRLWEEYIKLSKDSVSKDVDEYIPTFSHECRELFPKYDVRLYVYHTRLIEDSLLKMLNKHVRVPFMNVLFGDSSLSDEEAQGKLTDFKAEIFAFLDWVDTLEGFKFSRKYIVEYMVESLQKFEVDLEEIRLKNLNKT